MSGPTRGANEATETWTANPIAAFGLKVTAYGIPLVVAWLVLRFAAPFLWRPAGWVGLVLWILQGIVVGTVVSSVTERQTRRILPLAALMGMSMVFPDQAPSRFGVALRSGTVKRLEAQVDRLATDGLGDDAANAAQRAIELVAALSSHDRLTRGHTDRVRAYADLIAQELRLSVEDRLRLAWGVMLHDIGKLTVPADILNKESKLTDAEWEVLTSHPAESARILEPMADWLGPWIGAASEHHERWDGTGYPRGLRGDEISLAGRITAVADAFDVITSKRSYKSALSVEAGRRELVRCSGTQFDPEVVRALLSVSLGHRWTAGPLAWLTELPSVARVGTMAGSAVSTGAVAGAAVVATALPLMPPSPPPAMPTAMAFVEPVEVDDDILDLDAETVPREPADGAAADGAPVEAPPTTTGSTSSAPETELRTGPEGTGPLVPDSASTAADPIPAAATAPSLPNFAPAAATPAASVPPSTTTAPSITTTSAPVTTSTAGGLAPPPSPVSLFLTNPGTGDTSSAARLPLATSGPDAGSLPNYDANDNGDPGRTLKKHPQALATTDLRRYQEWEWAYTEPAQLRGPAQLRLWIAANDLRADDIGARVGLYRCDPGCVLLSEATWQGTGIVDDFRLVTFDFPSIDTEMTTGSTLVIKVVADQSLTKKDIWLAYDADGYVSTLTIG